MAIAAPGWTDVGVAPGAWWRQVPHGVRLALFAAGYVALSEIGLRLTFEPAGVAAYWPAAGLAIGVAVRWSPRRWPALLAVLLTANLAHSLLHGRAAGTAAGFALANAAETALAAALAHRWGATTVRTAGAYARLCAAVAAGVAGGGAAAGAVAAATGNPAWLSAAVVWAGSDGLGALLVAPMLLDTGSARGPTTSRRHVRWAVCAGTVAVVVGMFTLVRAPLAYVALAAVVCAAAALPRRTFAASLALAASAAVVLTAHGRGPFVVAGWTTNQRVLAVVGFLAVCAVLGMLLSCLLSARADAEAASERARTLLRAVLDRSPVGILHVDRRGVPLVANPQWPRLTGTTRPAPLDALAAVVPDDAAAVALATDRMRAGHRVDDCEFRVRTVDGERWLAASAAPVPPPDGGYVVSVTDVTERRRAAELTLVETVVRSAPIGMCLVETTGDGAVHAVRGPNPALCTLLGTQDPESIAACLRPALPGAGEHVETELQRADGRAVWVRASTATLDDGRGGERLLVLQVEDVSDRKAAERDLVHRALHDPLTGLPNRQLLADRLDHALARARRDGTTVAVLYVDLDHFKSVNDRFGHEAGDRLLAHVGHRLASSVRGADTAARIGGDEFVLLAQVPAHPGGDPAVEAEGIASRVRAELARPFDLDGVGVAVSGSIGLVLAAADDDPAALLRDSDAAMYDAKNGGRNRFRVYDASMRARVHDLRAVEEETRRALDQGRLAVHYQPLVDVTGTVRGVEALLRIEDPRRGVQLPGRAIRAAEESRLIADLGRWVLRRVMLDAPEVSRRLGDDVRFWFNLSARHPGYDDVPALVRKTAADTGFGLDRLVVEITESAMLETDRSFVAGLAALRETGVGVAVDDFGTGYSSLTYLRTLPLDVLKIDGSFVAGAQDATPDRDIVSAVVGLARGLGLTVVAEGVETQAQQDTVVALGADLLQGFHLGRPVPLDALSARPPA